MRNNALLEDIADAIAAVCVAHGITADPDALDDAAHAARLALRPPANARPLPKEGIDRCPCGAKYWEGDRCASCGERFDPGAVCASCNGTDAEFHDPTVADGAWLCESCYLEMRPT